MRCNYIQHLYIPQHLNQFDTSNFNQFSGSIHYYDSFNFTHNTVDSVTDHAREYHAEIEEGVTQVGNGTTLSSNSDTKLRLISVNFNKDVKIIKANAFKDFQGLTYVTFDNHSECHTIEDSAFEGCTNIFDIKLPDSLTSIGNNAFKGTSNLETIYIPPNVTSIGSNAFTDSGIREVLILDELYSEGMFANTVNVKILPTVEFTEEVLTSSVIEATLNAKNLYKGCIFYPKINVDTVTAIEPEVYTIFPELGLYENILNEKYKTTGPISIESSKVIFPAFVGAYLKDIYSNSTQSFEFPIYKSCPDLSLYSRHANNIPLNNRVTNFIVLPGFCLILYIGLYDELGIELSFVRPLSNYRDRMQIFDNTLGSKARWFNVDIGDITSSIHLFYQKKLIQHIRYK